MINGAGLDPALQPVEHDYRITVKLLKTDIP